MCYTIYRKTAREPRKRKRMIRTEEMQNVRIKGFEGDGKWSAFDEAELNGKKIYLMEHNKYGDEAAYTIIDGECNLILAAAWNGWDDLKDVLEDMKYNNISLDEMTPYQYQYKDLED